MSEHPNEETVSPIIYLWIEDFYHYQFLFICDFLSQKDDTIYLFYEVTVNVSDPVMRDGGKYFAYKISGVDKDGPFEVFRRYSDFDHFR